MPLGGLLQQAQTFGHRHDQPRVAVAVGDVCIRSTASLMCWLVPTQLSDEFTVHGRVQAGEDWRSSHIAPVDWAIARHLIYVFCTQRAGFKLQPAVLQDCGFEATRTHSDFVYADVLAGNY